MREIKRERLCEIERETANMGERESVHVCMGVCVGGGVNVSVWVWGGGGVCECVCVLVSRDHPIVSSQENFQTFLLVHIFAVVPSFSSTSFKSDKLKILLKAVSSF